MFSKSVVFNLLIDNSLKRIQTRLHHNVKMMNLTDKFGRHHDYLRISLTERCNLRCKFF